jgi:hypothetical protein
VLEGIMVAHLTVARIAEGLRVSWNTAKDAVLEEGNRVLIDDPTRFDGVAVIGVDEYAWRHTRRGRGNLGIYRRMIAAYRDPDRGKGRQLMSALIESVSTGVPKALSEVITNYIARSRRLQSPTTPSTMKSPFSAPARSGVCAARTSMAWAR